MKTDAQKRAQAKYAREKVKHKTFDIFPSETDILRRLDEIKTQGEGHTAYIKRLIREDIERNRHS